MGDFKRHIVLGVALAAAAVAGISLFASGRGANGHGAAPQGWPERFEFSCVDCDHRWSETDAAALGKRFGGMPVHTKPVDCASCGRKSAYWMSDCPWCRKPYRSKFVGAKFPPAGADPCPHCGKDAMAWRP